MKKEKIKIKRALLSVSDKTGIVELAQTLVSHHVEIISTGGTGETLKQAGIPFTPIEKITGSPESFGGRMKTISFQIESALLFRRGHSQDEQDAKALGVHPIDLVVCNLYPFEKVLDKKADEDTLIENIDVGGPTMVRSAAKNFESVLVCTEVSGYADLQKEMNFNNGMVSFDMRKKNAAHAFLKLSQYDAVIANTLIEDKFIPAFKNPQSLRYGENPHQKAYLYELNNADLSLARAHLLQGKELSYNNILDADAAWRVVSDLHLLNPSQMSVVVVKHLNPCGVAQAHSLEKALELAWAGDPVSAFGGILGFSHILNKECALFLKEKFIEVIIAPDFSAEALEIFSLKKNLRLIKLPMRAQNTQEKTLRSVVGGLLIQDEDEVLETELRSVTQNVFPQEKYDLARFGITVCKYLKSNGIALVAQPKPQEFTLVGAG
ncbi:MAG: bifunctional phosphoribosylaminoimidazolecarboxamide formyltransferase/IMP cyclohydrolase, partial [Bacteriovoracaceae bacterium]|nr:bifunctional phosphoribosylaminoimidazolecarboxamide formyltransferase/IMP cyclohydrolase [Bacteriovoracaceae bacterium]